MLFDDVVELQKLFFYNIILKMEICKIIAIIYATFLIGFVFVRCHKSHQKSFQKMENKQIISGNMELLEIRSLEENIICLIKCTEKGDCSAVAISKTSKRCILLLEILYQALYSENNEWNLYRVDVDWQLVFRGTAGISIPLVSTWTGSTNTTNPSECKDVTSTACKAHYRNPMIDSWTSFGVKEAKVELFAGGISVAMVKFDASGSDSLSWFSLSRVVDSTWNINKSDTFNEFQLIGNEQGRSFYVSQHHGCSQDRGYMIAVDVAGIRHCSYEKVQSYPQFLYSKGTDKTIWDTNAFRLADALTVYVRLT